jgi:hypothetical protein
MPVWKVLIILLLACVCMGLVGALIVVPMSYNGAMMWVWLVGLLFATAVVGGLFAMFLRYAGASLDVKPRGGVR